MLKPLAWTAELRALVKRALAAAGQERFLMRDLRAKHASDFETAGGHATRAIIFGIDANADGNTPNH